VGLVTSGYNILDLTMYTRTRIHDYLVIQQEPTLLGCNESTAWYLVHSKFNN